MRIEPGAAAHVRLALGCGRAARGVEHLDHLGKQRDACIERDLLGREAVGLAAAVPVFVERMDRERHAFG